MADLTFKANLLPNTDLGKALGSSTQRWKINGYTLEDTYIKKSGDTMTGQLYINYMQDAGLNQNGSLIIGTKTGTNIAIDNDEIMARNNGEASTLYLNYNGGNVDIRSSLYITKNTETGVEISNTQTTNPHAGLFGVGSSGNLGIYDRTYGKWVVYSNPSGNVELNGSAATLKDRTNSTLTYSNYGAAGLAASDVTWLTCWNGYELRAINKAEMANAVDSSHKWVRIGGDTMTGSLRINGTDNSSINARLYIDHKSFLFFVIWPRKRKKDD